MSLNVDGAWSANGPKACGGIIRDHKDMFHGAFSWRIKTCPVLNIELWAIFHGINMAKERGLSSLEIHFDS